MTVILSTCILFLALYLLIPKFYLKNALSKTSDDNAMYFIGVMLISVIVHFVCAASYPGHKTDMSCFSAWADMVYKGGIGNFYTSKAFHDYPPGYMYVLYVIGAIKALFNPSSANVLIKTPAIICSLLTGCLLYRLSRKKFSAKTSAVLSALYLLNPAVIVNGSLWGQVDSVYTLTILAMVYLIAQKKLILSYFVFAISIFIKPQALIFTPVLLLGIIENLFLTDFSAKKVVKNLLYGIGAIAMIVVLALPFGISNVVEQYVKTVSEQYPYFTVNAFNLWGALGKNWDKLTSAGTVLGYVFIVAITLYSAYVFLKCKSKSKYYFTAAMLSFMTYMLSVKMHDRYAFPVMVFLIAAFIESKNFKTYLLYALATISQYFNTVWVLFIYEQDINVYFKSPVIVAASIVNIALLIYMIYLSWSLYVKNGVLVEAEPEVKMAKKTKGIANAKGKAKPKENNRAGNVQKSTILAKLTRFDIIAVTVLVLVYGAIALYDLGDMAAPETEVSISSMPVKLDLGSEADISELKFFNGLPNINSSQSLTVQFRDGQNELVKNVKIENASVFSWHKKEVDVSARYVLLYSENGELNIKELALYDGEDYIVPTNLTEKTEALFDEQALIPERFSFRNSTYFDEIYHARTAYEFINKLEVYEWTHPPLGKLFIALGIKIFGMNPFGWRIAGTFFGIMMVPVMYIFAKRFFKHSWIAVATCVLFTFDFMHFAQTRIATIDVYVTFFIMLMYYYMFKYLSMSFYDTEFKKTLVPLALSGLFMGMGIASKWTGVYAGIGLAVLFFASLAKRYTEYVYARKNPKNETNGIKHSHIIESFKPCAIKTVLWCCLFFVLVPAIIYVLSYIPYMQTPSGKGLKTVIENAQSMFAYHARTVLGSEHPYSSRWFEWPIMVRPIWFYSGRISQEIREGISSFGNPALWWAAIPVFFMLIYNGIAKKDKIALCLVVSYLAQLIPWVPISRLTFIYHYFPCVPFLALMMGYFIYSVYTQTEVKSALLAKRVRYGVFAYVLVAVVLFAMFYPVLSGQPCSMSFAESWLKWFDSWVLL